MLAFKISINEGAALTAGVEDASILGLHISAGFPELGKMRNDQYVEFSVGGLTKDDENGVSHHFRWPRVDLAVGDIVSVEIVEVCAADVPIKRYRSDSEVRESPFTEDELREMKYRSYLKLKDEFEPDLNKAK